LVDDSSSQERILVKNEELENRRQALTQALSDLNVRERRIFEARRLAEDPIPLGELAEEFGISGERVRQIEVSCLRKGAKGGQTSSCHHRAARTLASQTSSFTWGFVRRVNRRRHGQGINHLPQKSLCSSSHQLKPI
jgi:hypothetical protein